MLSFAKYGAMAVHNELVFGGSISFHQAPLTLEEVQLDILLCEHGNLAAVSVVDIRTLCEGNHMIAVNAAANSAGSIYSAHSGIISHMRPTQSC